MDKSLEVELLRRAKCFDLQALADIYDRYSLELFAYSARLLGCPGEAEECVSETFSRFLGALKNGGGPRDHLRAYLYRIAHNWITDQYRQQPPVMISLEEEMISDDPHVDLSAQQKLWIEQVRAALHCLTPEQRQVVQLKFVEGWGNEEISAAIEKPIGAVKSLQHRALGSLKRMLGTKGDYNEI